MPLFTHASPYPETLVSLLGAHIASDITSRPDSSPTLFATPWILTPNAHIRRWLELRLAHAHGIAIGLHFEYPESGAWALLENVDPSRPPKRLPREVLHWMIFFLLRTGALGEAEAPVRAYVGDLSSGDPHAVRKGWQLADALSRHLREYAFRDPDRIGRWLAGAVEGDPWARVQATLFRAVFGKGGMRDRLAGATGILYRSLPEYEAACPPQRILPPSIPALHLFGTRNLNPWLVRFYQGWAMHNPVHLYLTDCGETAEGGEEAFWTREMRTWRLPALDARSLWRHSTPVAPAQRSAKTHLQAVQAFLRGESGAGRVEADGSLLLRDAPGLRREVEGVYEDILTRLRGNPQTRLTDIAILVPDMRRYSPVIQSVFDRAGSLPDGNGMPHVPINLVDAAAGEESLYAAAVRGLFDLMDGEAPREAVLEWLRNPAVMEARGLSDADLASWADLAEALGIYAGLNSDAPRGWQRGMRRLAWGRLLTADSNPVSARTFDHLVPHAGGGILDTGGINRFLHCIRSLSGLHRELHASDLTWERAFPLLQDALTEWIGTPPDAPGEASVAHALQAALNQAARCLPVLADGTRPNLPALRRLVEDSLAPLPLRRGARFCGGVTVAALKPESVVPFAHVYILGLGEGHFPGRAAHRPLDLLEPEAGAREAPVYRCQAFLDALLSARKSLWLSWVGRDLQTDEVFEPCGLLTTLRHAMVEAELPALPLGAIPFHAASRRYFDPHDPVADLTQRPFDRLQGIAALPASVALPPDTTDSLRRARREDDFALPVKTEPLTPPRIRHDTRTLARFLELPAAATLTRRLHVRTRNHYAPPPVEDDPLTMPTPVRGRILQACVEGILLTHEQTPLRTPETLASCLADLWDPVRDALAGQGLLPEAPFGEVALQEIADTLRAMIEGGLGHFLLEHAPPDSVPCGGIVLGRHGLPPRVRTCLPPLRLPGGAELHAGLPWVWESSREMAILVPCLFSAPPSGKAPDTHGLEPYLSLTAYRAATGSTKPASLHSLYKNGSMRHFDIPPEPDALEWLGTLAEAWNRETDLIGIPYAELRRESSRLRRPAPAEEIRAWLLDEIANPHAFVRWPDALRIAEWEIPEDLQGFVEARWSRILALTSS